MYTTVIEIWNSVGGLTCSLDTSEHRAGAQKNVIWGNLNNAELKCTEQKSPANGVSAFHNHSEQEKTQ